MRLLDKIIDIVYPRPDGEPDRAGVGVKLLVLLLLGGILALGIAANWLG